MIIMPTTQPESVCKPDRDAHSGYGILLDAHHRNEKADNMMKRPIVLFLLLVRSYQCKIGCGHLITLDSDSGRFGQLFLVPHFHS